MVNIYNYIITLFQDITAQFSSGIFTSLIEVLKIQALFNAIGMIIVVIWCVKKLEEGDLFTFKNILQICIMLFYIGFFNWTIQNPTKYIESFKYFIEYPANILTEKISIAVAPLTQKPTTGNFSGGIDWLIQKSFESASEVVSRTSLTLGWGGIQGSFIAFLMALVYYACTTIFIIVILLVTIIAALQIMIWEALAIIMLTLMFLPQTRGMVGKYIMFLITLTLYKPMVLTMAFFNFSVSQYIITNLPDRKVFENAQDFFNIVINNVSAQVSTMGYLLLGIVGCFIATFLVKQIPEFLSNVVGTSTSLGKAIASSATGAMAGVAGAGGGAALAGTLGAAKNAYQGSGGGVGGLANTALGMMTAGLSNKLGGNKLGEKINDKINQSKLGNTINSSVSGGVSSGSNAMKQLGEKIGSASKKASGR